MNLNIFITKLKAHKGKELLFQYTDNKTAGANYHLTEVKNVHFDTVDCGGNKNNWKETHLQLWESPKEIEKIDFLTVNKVIDIINRVDSINPLWLETEVKVEFGNKDFHTSILDVFDFNINNNQLIVVLSSVKTGCKAPSACSIETEESSCCSTTSSCC